MPRVKKKGSNKKAKTVVKGAKAKKSKKSSVVTYGGYNYIDKNYKPSKEDFVVWMWMKGEKPLPILAEAVAAESSVGTFTKIKTMNKRVFTHYRAHVFEVLPVQDNAGFVKIAYPFEHFDAKNLLQFEASVLGNIFGMLELDELYVIDIAFPKKFQRYFSGPIGLNAIRKYLGTDKNKRPHVGTIVKPKVGLTPKEFAHVAYEAYIGGLDLVKDDENLVDQPFCPWKKRFDEVYAALDKVETKTGEKKLYATNISDISLERMLDRLDYVAESGAKMIMLDVFVAGPAVVKMIAEEAHRKGLFVHAHRAGYAAMHRGRYGYSFGILAKLYRLLGVDQLHVGTGVGKMDGSPTLIRHFGSIVRDRKLKESWFPFSLSMEYEKHVAKTFPVASGGLHAGLVEGVVEIFGTDVIIQAGGGVHGHPRGTRAGAESLRAAAEAAAKGISIKTAAKRNKALKEAIDHFGFVPREHVRAMLNFGSRNKKTLEAMIRKGGYDVARMFDKTLDPRGD